MKYLYNSKDTYSKEDQLKNIEQTLPCLEAFASIDDINPQNREWTIAKMIDALKEYKKELEKESHDKQEAVNPEIENTSENNEEKTTQSVENHNSPLQILDDTLGKYANEIDKIEITTIDKK
jgi:hypothetical protein